jgi:hypothetical protein
VRNDVTTTHDAPAAGPETGLAEIVEIMRRMYEVSTSDPIWLRRKKSITIQYEFVVDGALVVYHGTANGRDWSFDEGALPDEDCDVIMRTSPAVLNDVLFGVSGGREAMLSGEMSMRKAPDHPNLLLMRAMFNRYTKFQERGELADLTAPGE